MSNEQKALARKWIAALRSGTYKQGENYLHQGDSFCCLGVLCEVVGLPSKIGPNDVYTYDDYSRIIPTPSVLAMVGVDPEKACKLTDMNDKGRTFSFIADHLEKTLLQDKRRFLEDG